MHQTIIRPAPEHTRTSLIALAMVVLVLLAILGLTALLHGGSHTEYPTPSPPLPTAAESASGPGGKRDGVSSRAGEVQVTSSVSTPDLSLKPATQPARMTKAQALAVAESQFGKATFAHGYSAAYGSFTDNASRRNTGVGMQAIGTRNVWKLTVTGNFAPRPCAFRLNLPASCPPDPHTFVVMVDDHSGQFLEGISY
jgi:hypothetical protein